MAKDEKILKKIDKLLKAYGVENEQERQNFLNDVQDSKYDEEEIVEENDKVEEPTEPVETNEQVEETTETEETEKVEEEVEEPTDNLPIDDDKEEVVEEQVETDTPNEEEVAEVGEEVVEEPVQPELPNEEPQVQEVDAVETLKGELDEMKKSNEGLVARLEHLETILSKLGVPTEEQFGESPMAQKGLEDNSDMAEINRKRLGY